MDKKNQEHKQSSPAKKDQNLFEQLRIGESYVSLFLGIFVVFIGIFLLITFTKINSKTQEISSVKTEELPQTIDTKKSAEQEKYTVLEGDTLWGIAEKKLNSGSEWNEIAKANDITDPGGIKAGDVISIPKTEQEMNPSMESKSSASAVSVRSTESASDTQKIVQDSYSVVAGDTLWDIAVRAYGDGFRWKDIAEANNLDNPDLIFAGNSFKLPR